MRIGILWISGILLLSFSASGQVETFTKLLKQQETLHNTQAYQESIQLGEKTLLDLSATAAPSLDSFKTQVLYLLCQSNGSMQNFNEAKVRCQEYRTQVQKTAGNRSAAYFEAQFLEILLRQLEGGKEGVLDDYHALIATKDNYDGPLENILGLMYAKMGSFSLGLNEYENAIAYYEQAEYYWLEAVNCRDIAAIYETLAAYFQTKGWLEKAMVYFQKALAIYYEEGNIWAGVYSNIAVNYSKMGDFEKAAEYNEKAIATGGMNLEDLRSTYNNLGGNYLDLGQNEKAQATFEKAIHLGESFQGRFTGGAISIIRLGIAHWRQGRHEKAYQLWQDILLEAKTKEQFIITIFAAAEWAKAKSSLGEHLEALEIWGYGYPALTGDYSLQINDPFEELARPAAGANLYAARYWNLRGDFLMKLQTEEPSDDILNLAEKAYRNAQQVALGQLEARKESKFYYGVYEGLHLGLLNVLYEREETNFSEAFAYSEQLRQARSIMELEEAKKLKTGTPTELETELQELKKQIVRVEEQAFYQESQLGRGGDSLVFYTLRDSIFGLYEQLDQRREVLLAKEEPTRVISVDRVSLTEVQETILQPGELLIEYSLGDSIGFGLALSSEKGVLIRFDTPEVIELVKTFRQRILRSHESPSDLKAAQAFLDASHQLFQKIVAPILTQWPEGQLHTIRIVPDGILSYLPFEALLMEPSPPVEGGLPNYAGLSYLLSDYSVSYLNSVGLLTELRNWPREKAPIPIGAFAAEYLDLNLDEGLLAEQNRVLKGLREGNFDLPGARQEVQSIERIVPSGRSFLATTESMFKSVAEDYQILHLALHALVNEDSPLYSQFIFTADAEGGENGLLNASELYEMNLRADLAFLSACNSGSGAFNRGRGVQSLARALHFAGVPSVVMSLWQLPDGPTAELVPYFYEALVDQEDLDKALQQAKLQYLNKAQHPLQAHPFNWAGLQLVGEKAAIPVPSTHGGYYLWLVFMGAGLLIWRLILARTVAP